MHHATTDGRRPNLRVAAAALSHRHLRVRSAPGVPVPPRGARAEEDAAPYQAAVDEGLGAAVAILIDTSGSMREKAAGDSPAQVCRRAGGDRGDARRHRRVRRQASGFSDQDRHLQFLEQRADAAADSALRSRRDPRRRSTRLPRPGGGTAIGEALREARPDLYRAGVFRKYLLVVTDGDNTSGRDPESVAREIFSKSQGAVQVYFVAFDTTPQKFAFLKEVGGDVIGAGTGEELHKALDGIYQGKILAEAPDAGEREPARK